MVTRRFSPYTWRFRRRWLLGLCAVLVWLPLQTPGAGPARAAATLDMPTDLFAANVGQLARLRATVNELCSTECAGRRVGTPGAERAAAYLEAQLMELGVAPLEGMRNLRLGFAVTQGIRTVGTPQLILGGEELPAGSGFTVASFSGSGQVDNLPVVFAAYGITAPEVNWNDYAGLDVKGQVVAIVRGEPNPPAAGEAFNGAQPSVYSDLRRKAATARDLGAAALLILNNPRFDEDVLPELRPTYSSADFNLPVLHLHADALDGQLDLLALMDEMDRSGQPQTRALTDFTASIDLAIEKDMATGFDLVGVIPGSDPQLASQYVVLGAHYDHLGVGGPESTAPEQYGQIHYGADDNASGVAAVLEIARWATVHRGQFKRSILVCLFSGEEVGLLGSTALLANLPLPQESLYCMLNLDMVGRLRENKLYIGTVASAAEFMDVLNGLPQQYGLTIAPDKSGLGGSDHMSFLSAGIPALFFFTGPHEEYHSPRDRPETLNIRGLAQISAFAGDVLAQLACRDGALSFQQPEGVSAAGPTRKERKVSMGTTPAYEGSELPGYLIGEVRPGGPADKAGMLAGDRVVKIGDRIIANIYDFVFALQDLNPGDTREVMVMRGEGEVRLSVTFEARSVEQ